MLWLILYTGFAVVRIFSLLVHSQPKSGKKHVPLREQCSVLGYTLQDKTLRVCSAGTHLSSSVIPLNFTGSDALNILAPCGNEAALY